MVYQVFARKYRPQTFEDVIAQEHVTKTLQNAVKNDRIGSGYLFCGPRGTGKTTTARLLAKCLNCVKGPTPIPCGECPACNEIASGASLDVLEIDAASNTGVDDVRTLRENVRYLPTSGNKRIFIIDEVHRLSGAAFDALLKTLEEPPAHVVFVFATTEPLKVPDTILSRTQRFDFKRVSSADLEKHLKNIAYKEKIKIDDAPLALLARKADGSVRDSLSLLDQVAAFAGDKITEQDVVDALGLVDREMLFSICESIAARDTKAILTHIRKIEEAGVDAKDFLMEMLDHFRILMILSTDKESKELLKLSNDETEAYVKQSDYFSTGDLVRLLKMAADMNRDLKSGLDERLVLEMGSIRMASMESTVQFEEILAHLKQNPITSQTNSDLFGQSSKKKDDQQIKSISITKKSEASPALSSPSLQSYSKSINMPTVQAGWDGFITVLKQKSNMLASQLSMADLREISDNNLVLYFGSNASTSLQVCQRSDNMTLIMQVLRDYYKANIGINLKIDPDKKSVHAGADNIQKPKVDVNKLVENSPRIKMLIDKIDGEIVGVKQLEKPPISRKE